MKPFSFNVLFSISGNLSCCSFLFFSLLFCYNVYSLYDGCYQPNLLGITVLYYLLFLTFELPDWIILSG